MSAYTGSVALGVLLIVEVAALTFAFDTQAMDSVPGAWAAVIASSPQALRLSSSIAVASAALLAVTRPTPFRLLNIRREPVRLVQAGAVHVVGIGLFAWVTSVAVAAGAPYRLHAAWWTLTWLVSGATSLVAWALMLLPPNGWRILAVRGRASLLAGTIIGAVGWAFGFVAQEFWVPVSEYTFAVVTWMLRFVFPRTVSNPAKLVVGTPEFRIQIAPGCSGYEGVGLIVAFLALYFWWCRKDLRFPHALMLLPIGAAVVWLANALRIVALIAIGTAGWRGIATGGFHSQAGWIAFNAIALGFVMLTHRWAYFHRASVPAALEQSSADDGNQTTAYLGPFIVVSATAMLTGLFSSGFDWLYPLRVFAAGACLWGFRRHYLALQWSWSWWAPAIGVATFVGWIALVPHGPESAGWPATLRSVPVGWAIAWFFFRTVGYIVMTPLAEELAFRGFLTRRLSRTDFYNLPLGTFSWWAFIGSSVLFGALHGNHWLPATLAGMSFGLALYKRGALGDAVWAHVTTNGLLAAYACATGQWSVWS